MVIQFFNVMPGAGHIAINCFIARLLNTVCVVCDTPDDDTYCSRAVAPASIIIIQWLYLERKASAAEYNCCAEELQSPNSGWQIDKYGTLVSHTFHTIKLDKAFDMTVSELSSFEYWINGVCSRWKARKANFHKPCWRKERPICRHDLSCWGPALYFKTYSVRWLPFFLL